MKVTTATSPRAPLGAARLATLLLATLLMAIPLAGCTLLPAKPQPSGAALTPGEAEQLIATRAQQAIEAIRDGNTTGWMALAHPDKGIRFSPYSSVREENLRFAGDLLRGLSADPAVYTWGAFDGSGEPIQLTFRQYYQRFIYTRDFASAPQVIYNQVIARGNTINNAREFYPDAIFVEYHFPGTESYGGMDWQSLRLVFEAKGRTWYLVGIIHDEWTI